MTFNIQERLVSCCRPVSGVPVLNEIAAPVYNASPARVVRDLIRPEPDGIELDEVQDKIPRESNPKPF